MAQQFGARAFSWAGLDTCEKGGTFKARAVRNSASLLFVGRPSPCDGVAAPNGSPHPDAYKFFDHTSDVIPSQAHVGSIRAKREDRGKL